MSSSQDREWQYPATERAGLLFPGDHQQTSHHDQRQQERPHHHQHLGRTRTRSRSPARLLSHLPRPTSLLIIASLDLLTTLLFTFILDLHSRDPYNRTAQNHGRPNTTLRLLTLGYVRSSCTLGMVMRKNWTSRGRLGVLLGFVGTGLEVLWEINTRVLYRGWKGNAGKDRAVLGGQGVFKIAVEGDEGKRRLIFLILQIVFASIEYVAYALSIHYAARPNYRSSNGYLPPDHMGGRQRATSIRFDERDRQVDQDVFGPMSGGRTDLPGFLRPPTQNDQVDQDLSASDADDDEGRSEISTESDVSEDDLERSSGSSEEDEDEIIDLPLPEEAKIERKTSIMSLRSRHGAGSYPQGSGVGGLSDEEQGVGTGPHDEDGDEERRLGVWGSIRGALGWDKKSDRKRRRDGYGTI